MALIVQKFGGSSVANADRVRNVARIITETYRKGHSVVVVLSAQGDTTDDLIAKAAEINPHASKREMDMLLATGEQISISLCAMAIEAMGYQVVSLTGWQAGVNTDSAYGGARIKRIQTERIQTELDKRKIVLVAGFQGINKYGDVTTLGRGGSDTSAVALAAALHADLCQIYTDVDGVYTADFDTDSSMFHANEANDGKGTLTVKDGQMTFHVSLASKKIVNLYVGMAADAEAHEGDWLQPTTDTVTYSDGLSDEVYGFDIPVKALDEDFQLAILGTKGKWYDHTVRVANAQPAAAEAPADGTYTCDVTLEGGSGRATVESPAALTVADGRMTATIVWSSPNYDYMLVDGEKYLPTNTEGNSTFEIPVTALDTPLDVVGDTVAMSTPHEIEYTLTFASASLIEAK